MQNAALWLVEMFLAGRNPNTLAAYRDDLNDFAAHLGMSTLGDGATALLGNGHGEANALALSYRTALVERRPPLAAATVNRRLAALRALVRLGRILGLVVWELEVPGVRRQPYRDTRGPGDAVVNGMLANARAREDALGARNYAILRLLRDLALRRNEVVTLDREHADLAAGTIAVLGKGRTGREKLSLPEPTKEALATWLVVRGHDPGPLFTNLDRAHLRGRLTPASVYRVVREAGAELGVAAWPHGIRHASITRALDVTGGDVRAVQRYSRHRDPRTVMIYDDARRDIGGQVARAVAGEPTEKPETPAVVERETDPSSPRTASSTPSAALSPFCEKLVAVYEHMAPSLRNTAGLGAAAGAPPGGGTTSPP
jgi:integrase/recombinase XerC